MKPFKRWQLLAYMQFSTSIRSEFSKENNCLKLCPNVVHLSKNDNNIRGLCMLKLLFEVPLFVWGMWEHLAVRMSKQLSPLFVCPSHIGCSRCPVWISFNVNLLSLSIRIQLNVRGTRAVLPCLFLCALPEWTSTGYGNIGSLIWIIRQRRLRYLCSRCI